MHTANPSSLLPDRLDDTLGISIGMLAVLYPEQNALIARVQQQGS